MQPSLPLQLPAARPLVPVECIIVLLDCSEEEVLRSVQSGGLRWAWDIRHPGASRAELRVWRESLLEAIAGIPSSDPTPDQVIASLLPHQRDTLRSTELHRLLSCSQQHTAGLVHAGLLQEVGTRPQIRGCNSFMRVTRASLVQFLRARRYQ